MRSTDADREEKDEEGGEDNAEEVGTAESTLGPSPQGKKGEEVSKENATETFEQQSSEEKTLEETNNTVSEVDQPWDSDENFKTVIDERTIGVEDKEVVAVHSGSQCATPQKLSLKN